MRTNLALRPNLARGEGRGSFATWFALAPYVVGRGEGELPKAYRGWMS